MIGLWIGALWCALAASDSVIPQSVELVVSADSESAVRLEGVLTELLGRIRITLTVHRVDKLDTRQIFTTPAADAHIIARVWIDATDGTQANVYLLDPPSARLLVRQVPMADGLDELAREQVAHIIGDAVGALRAGRSVGLPVEDVRASLAMPAASPSTGPISPVRQLVWEAGIMYELQGFSSVAAPHGFGAMVGAMNRGPTLSLGGTVVVVSRAKIEADNERVRLGLAPLDFRLIGTLELPLRGRLSLAAGLGAVIDVIQIRPATELPAVQLAKARSRVAILATGFVGLSWRLRRFSLLAAVVADGGPSSTRYYVETGDGRETLVDGWPVRPGVFLALKYGGGGN